MVCNNVVISDDKDDKDNGDEDDEGLDDFGNDGFIVDDLEEDDEAGRKRRQDKGKRKKRVSERIDELDEDDYELIMENKSLVSQSNDVSKNFKEKQKLNKSLVGDDEDISEGEDGADIADVDDMADFIDDEEIEEPSSPRKYSKKGKQSGTSSTAIQAAREVFGDVEDVLLSRKSEASDNHGGKSQDQFHPSVLCGKYTTQKDERIRETDVPERMQGPLLGATSDTSDVSLMSIDSHLDMMEVDTERVEPLWKQTLRHLLEEIVDQGFSESCTAVVMSDLLLITMLMEFPDLNISRPSRQFMMDHTYRAPHPRKVNPEAIHMLDLYELLVNVGVVYEENYCAYRGFRNIPAPPPLREGPRVFIESGECYDFEPENWEKHMDKIAQLLPLIDEFPLVGAIRLTYTFTTWKGNEMGMHRITNFLNPMDIYEDLGDVVVNVEGEIPGHAILLIDYNYSPERKAFVVQIKNSAGPYWGQNGLAWIDSRSLIHISYPVNPRLCSMGL
ncbi:hypothetical protein OROGR_005397 [Orobanche gracilis]